MAFPAGFNPHANKIWDADFLYHYGLGVEKVDFVKNFGDVRLVLVAGSPNRIGKLAAAFAVKLDLPTPVPIGSTERFTLYKVGPVLLSSHGMGQPSMSIALHELAKLLVHANVDITKTPFIRLGTSGGLDLEPGTVVISSEAVSGSLRSEYRDWILGEEVVYTGLNFDTKMCEKLQEVAKSLGIPFVTGKTCGTHDFYEGQGRTDGALCRYTEEERVAFLHKARASGVRNFEMECPYFASFCKRLGIPAGCMCVAILNRFKSDQVVQLTHEQLAAVEEYNGKIAMEYLNTLL